MDFRLVLFLRQENALCDVSESPLAPHEVMLVFLVHANFQVLVILIVLQLKITQIQPSLVN